MVFVAGDIDISLVGDLYLTGDIASRGGSIVLKLETTTLELRPCFYYILTELLLDYEIVIV